MKTKREIQYTIRAVPEQVDRALRQRAKKEGRSLNDVAREALERGTGLHGEPRLHHDLDQYSGTWVDDPAVEETLKAQDRVDESLWQ